MQSCAERASCPPYLPNCHLQIREKVSLMQPEVVPSFDLSVPSLVALWILELPKLEIKKRNKMSLQKKFCLLFAIFASSLFVGKWGKKVC